jgi:hypothetical protein
MILVVPSYRIKLVTYASILSVTPTLKSPSIADRKNGDWEQTMARWTRKLKPWQAIVISEYWPLRRSAFICSCRCGFSDTLAEIEAFGVAVVDMMAVEGE